MIRPGFYLGRAYANKVFLLNFMLLNDEVAEAGLDGFARGDEVAEDCWTGEQLRQRRSRLRLALAALAGRRGPRRPAPAARRRTAARRRPLLAEVFPDGLPFPFEAVLDRLRARRPGLRTSQTALIPLGRSLQRYAAAPRLLRLAAHRRRRHRRPRRRPARPPPRRPPLPRLPARRRGDRGDQLRRRRRPLRVPGGGRLRRGPAAPAEPAERRVCLACHQGGGTDLRPPALERDQRQPRDRRPPRPARRQLPRRRRSRQTVDALEAFDAATDRAARIAARRPPLGRGLPRRRLPRRAPRRRAPRRPRRRAARRPAGLRRADTPALARRRRRRLARPAEPRSAAGLRRHRRPRGSPAPLDPETRRPPGGALAARPRRLRRRRAGDRRAALRRRLSPGSTPASAARADTGRDRHPPLHHDRCRPALRRHRNPLRLHRRRGAGLDGFRAADGSRPPRRSWRSPASRPPAGSPSAPDRRRASPTAAASTRSPSPAARATLTPDRRPRRPRAPRSPPPTPRRSSPGRSRATAVLALIAALLGKTDG